VPVVSEERIIGLKIEEKMKKGNNEEGSNHMAALKAKIISSRNRQVAENANSGICITVE